MKPLVSIILPTYNGSKYIAQSIESCLTQTYTNFELIIVNDCSTDNVLEIISQYANRDARIKIINNEINKRLPASLNVGFSEAKGKYHTWTSDDNYYADNAIEEMVNILEANSKLDLVYADYTLIDDNSRIKGTKTFNNIYDGFTKWEGCGACFLYKAEIFKSNKGYNVSAFLIEDYDFFVRAFINHNFYYLNKYNLYYYREHDASLTGTQGDNVNYLSKIIIERQLPALATKLSKSEMALLYRKFAVFNAVYKNNYNKYFYYLKLLRSISFKHFLITILASPLLKIKDICIFFINNFVSFIKLIFR